MPWQRRMFKGNKVYAQVDPRGELLVERGRVRISYKIGDPRTYEAAAASVSRLPDGQGGDVIHPDPVAPALSPEPSAGGMGTSTPANGGDQATAAPDATAPSKAGPAKAPSQRAKKTSGKKAAAPAPPVPTASESAGGVEPIVIYTDGACEGNPGPAGIGVVLMSGSHRKEISEYLGEGLTNNIAELVAIQRGLEAVKDRRRTVLVHSDSAYSIGVLSGWKALANLELITRIKRLMSQFADLRFVKVEGHAGVEENERCDELARIAVQSARDQSTSRQAR